MAGDELPSPPTPNTYYSSVFTSPKFRFLSSKITPFDSIVSPTSILEANPSFFSSQNPKPTSYLEPTIPKPQRFLHPPEAFGLADLVKNRDHSSKPANKMVLFGSKLRVQIPSSDFGTKTGPTTCQTRHPHGQLSPCLKTKVLAVSEIDQTEDYTRVISHGPNPTITHIFDNSVFVEEATPPPPFPVPFPLETKKSDTGFLSNCYTCKKNLDQKHDIYIYRGEKGFCSSECRYQEMLLDQIET
ncbi:Protein MARD1 [Hirschfeldia incana]|nr:Protein MARD1 [Hirschfeldia incana]